MKLLVFTLLVSTALSTRADTVVESRIGFTLPHSEGAVIARYLIENEITYSYKSFSATLLGNIYGTQNWAQRVKNEDGMWKVDDVKFEYGGEIGYRFADDWRLYTRHTMPVDRHDGSTGDGWTRMSYRWDAGVVYRRKLD